MDSMRLQAYYRETARAQMEALSVPPFTLFLDPADQSVAFAIPDSPAAGDLGEPLRQIDALCARRERTACVRFVHGFAPELAQSLRLGGYEETECWPILVCTPESFCLAKPVDGLEIITVSSNSSLETVKENWNANALGYDLKAELATGEQAIAFRQSLENCLAFTARLDGQAVGAGMFNPIREQITEVVGITTLAPFRLRGIATYLTAYMAQTAFAHGAAGLFLVPENEQSERIYERVGFQLLTAQLLYRRRG